MNTSLVVCSSCSCHVRSSETVCPHCGADLATESAIRSPRRTWLEIGRTVFVVAMAGVGTVSCGNNRDPQVWGSCLDYDNCLNAAVGPGHSACNCGAVAWCDGRGECVACRCDAGVQNNCTLDYSTGRCYHQCYGAPPVLLAQVGVHL
jgi:hypothetical protein